MQYVTIGEKQALYQLIITVIIICMGFWKCLYQKSLKWFFWHHLENYILSEAFFCPFQTDDRFLTTSSSKTNLFPAHDFH